MSLAKCFPDWADRAGEAVISVYLNVYLQKGDDERSQGKVGGFLQLGVEFFNGEGGILEQRKKHMNACGRHYLILLIGS